MSELDDRLDGDFLWERAPKQKKGKPTLGPFGEVGRPTMALVALALALITGWASFIIRMSADRDGWYDLIVNLVFGGLFLTIGLFALLLLTWALFAPGWLARALEAAYRGVLLALGVFGILVAAGLVFLLVVGPILLKLGILE